MIKVEKKEQNESLTAINSANKNQININQIIVIWKVRSDRKILNGTVLTGLCGIRLLNLNN